MSKRPARAIILAAGKSKRLGVLTENLPKCLLHINGKTILSHQIENLTLNGITEITIVTGYYGSKIRKHCGNTVQYIENRDYATTNSLYSLWLALKKIQGDVLVLNSDVVFHPAILSRLLSAPYRDALAVCFQSSLGQEEMKVKIKNNKIFAISKDLDPADSHGENVGILKFSAEGRDILFEKAAELIQQGEHNAWAPLAFQHICASRELNPVETAELPWIEIDFESDLKRARQHIYPQICMSLSNKNEFTLKQSGTVTERINRESSRTPNTPGAD